MFPAFAMEHLKAMGVRKNTLSNGCRLSDGSVVLTDQASIETSKPAPFKVSMPDGTYEGDYVGVLAILSNASHSLRKFAAGGLKELRHHGKPILRLTVPSDVFFERTADNQTHIWIESSSAIELADIG